MTAVPRDANGNFLPPQYRLTSVRAGELKGGDVVSWNLDGRAVVLSVLWVVAPLSDGRVGLALTRPGETAIAWQGRPAFDQTVNRVEVLW